MNENGTAEIILQFEEVTDGDSEPSEQTLRVLVADEQDTLAIDEVRLIAAVQSVLADSKYSSATVSIAVVDDSAIHALNVEFLQHDYPTDVLSFVLEDSPDYLEGELIVSTDTARGAATEAGWPAEDELLLYVIHGALHLVGYCDKQIDRQAEMLAAEVACLQKLGIALPADTSRWETALKETSMHPGTRSSKELLS
ncbi:rRNA maturation RNase YbeY [Bythopirellula polymerisocia]|nr:rRNA maturation RNase YbeY [Bythopirellula polymerisocia]